MRSQTTMALLAVSLSGACSSGDVTSMMSPDQAAAADQSTARSGALVVRKDCHSYAGQAGGICTMTESSLDVLPAGSVITYASAAGPDAAGVVWLNSDITVDPPGPGNNAAFGHCAVNLQTGLGTCTLSGGTGKFTHINASVAVTPLGGRVFEWRGTYSYGK